MAGSRGEDIVVVVVVVCCAVVGGWDERCSL
jgi:hypothetical protein